MTDQTDDDFDDDPEEDFDDFFVNPAVTLTIAYRDGAGAASTRKVTVTNVSRDGETVMIEGYCYLRQDDRTFRLDRIERAETKRGKVMTGADLYAYLEARRSEDPPDFYPPEARSPQETTQGRNNKPSTSFREIVQGVIGLALIAGMIFGYVKAGWPGVGAAIVIFGFLHHFLSRAFK